MLVLTQLNLLCLFFDPLANTNTNTNNSKSTTGYKKSWQADWLVGIIGHAQCTTSIPTSAKGSGWSANEDVHVTSMNPRTGVGDIDRGPCEINGLAPWRALRWQSQQLR
ncbi:hypothetical protein [Bradyrhizobium sp. CER78]|uniref:hypothetical protein n=1 Tax=Bradyrhizobium sp. CER78 TaxID=3039162 RepID=UPI0024497708|nr:hypothetical protein [Bradyrhizobium sp. CER78]MDH2380703.1 hypothetical protein [Bradyrhizobium sp. CER78]